MERNMVHAGPVPVLLAADHVWRLLNHDVRIAKFPTVAPGPVLEWLVAKLSQHPPPFRDTAGNVGDPQLQMVKRADAWIAHGSFSPVDVYQPRLRVSPARVPASREGRASYSPRGPIRLAASPRG